MIMGSSFAAALAGRTGACREVGRVIVRLMGTRQIWGPSKWDVLGPCSVRGASAVVHFCIVPTKLVFQKKNTKLVVLYWYSSILDWKVRPYLLLWLDKEAFHWNKRDWEKWDLWDRVEFLHDLFFVCFPVWSFDNRVLIPESFCLFCSCLQVLPLVPPGRTSGEDGSPYSGQVIVYANRIDFFRFGVNLVCSLACLFMAVIWVLLKRVCICRMPTVVIPFWYLLKSL